MAGDGDWARRPRAPPAPPPAAAAPPSSSSSIRARVRSASAAATSASSGMSLRLRARHFGERRNVAGVACARCCSPPPVPDPGPTGPYGTMPWLRADRLAASPTARPMPAAARSSRPCSPLHRRFARRLVRRLESSVPTFPWRCWRPSWTARTRSPPSTSSASSPPPISRTPTHPGADEALGAAAHAPPGRRRRNSSPRASPSSSRRARRRPRSFAGKPLPVARHPPRRRHDGETVLVDLSDCPFGAGPAALSGRGARPRARRGSDDERLRRPAPPRRPARCSRTPGTTRRPPRSPPRASPRSGRRASASPPRSGCAGRRGAKPRRRRSTLARRLTHLPRAADHRTSRTASSTDPAEVAAYVDRLGRSPASTSRTARSPATPPTSRDQCSPRSSPRRGARSSTPASTPTGSAKDAGSRPPWSARTRYIDAGANGIFVPGVRDRTAEIAALAEALTVPLQRALRSPACPLPRLAELGVARISTGSLLLPRRPRRGARRRRRRARRPQRLRRSGVRGGRRAAATRTP